jgi:hypothetical protein
MTSFLEMVNPKPIQYENFYYQIYVPDARNTNSKVYFNSECRAFIYKEKNQNMAATDDMTSLEVEFSNVATINKCCFKTVDEFRKGIDQYIKFYHAETQSMITQLQIVPDYIYLKNVKYHKLGKDGKNDLRAELSKLTFQGGYRFTSLSNQLNWIIEKPEQQLLVPQKFSKTKISCDDEKEDDKENNHPNKKVKLNENKSNSSKSSPLSSLNHDMKDHDDDSNDDNDALDQEEGNHNNDDDDTNDDDDDDGDDDDSYQEDNNKNSKKRETLNAKQDKLVQSFLVRIKFSNI